MHSERKKLCDAPVQIFPEMGKSRSTWHRENNLYIKLAAQPQASSNGRT
jgi:hypothetical protein